MLATSGRRSSSNRLVELDPLVDVELTGSCGSANPEPLELSARGDGAETMPEPLRHERAEAVGVVGERPLARNDRQDARVCLGLRPERA